MVNEKLKIVTGEESERIQNISDLRLGLFDVIERLKLGTMDKQTAREIANASQVIINSVKLEMEYRRSINASRRIGLLEKNDN